MIYNTNFQKLFLADELIMICNNLFFLLDLTTFFTKNDMAFDYFIQMIIIQNLRINIYVSELYLVSLNIIFWTIVTAR